ncbi:MAG: TIGR00153 family protein [Gammaproteobacteria bacterium]|nr:TIGR00153 family protein [Gammaproteobacteria bacterium]
MVSKNYMYRLFGRSPVKPLQTHMEKVLLCVQELIPFFEAIIADDTVSAKTAQKNISKMEKDADKLKKELRLNLPTGMMMPVSRTDLLDILRLQDQVANKAKDIAGIMIGRKMSFPEDMAPLFLSYVTRCVDAAVQANKTVNELDELVETGFSGSEVDLVMSMIKELDRIEGDTDKIQIKIRATLFKIEKDLPPIDVMFLYKIIEWIGELADQSQRVGSRLEQMLAR